MWTCPKCGRSFKKVDQHHFCGEITTIDQLILSQPMRLYNSLYETSFLVDSYIFVPGWPVSARYSAENPSFRH